MPKINKDSTLNITFVGIGLCLLCSAIISFIAIQLRSVQENNVVLDMQKKIVSSAGLDEVYGSVENAMSNIKTLIIDLDRGEIVDINPDTYELSKELREDGKYKFLSAEEDVASIKKREKYSKVYIEYKDNEINTLILPLDASVKSRPVLSGDKLDNRVIWVVLPPILSLICILAV